MVIVKEIFYQQRLCVEKERRKMFCNFCLNEEIAVSLVSTEKCEKTMLSVNKTLSIEYLMKGWYMQCLHLFYFKRIQ